MTTPMHGVLTDHQAEVVRKFVLTREHERDHMVVYLSGAHAYGFPSPDSDLDLKCVHVAPTSEMVGLEPYEEPKDRIETIEGVELDYGSNELAGVLRGCIKGNGNYLERILGKLVVGGRAELLAEARAVVKPVLSRRVGRHYGGFARSQLELFDAKPTAKRALYVLRTTATGRHLHATGELVTDLTQLPQYAPAGLDELLAMKQQAEQAQLMEGQRTRLREQLVAAIAAVDDAWPSSVLPVDPPEAAVAAVDSWLRDVRRRHW